MVCADIFKHFIKNCRHLLFINQSPLQHHEPVLFTQGLISLAWKCHLITQEPPALPDEDKLPRSGRCLSLSAYLMYKLGPGDHGFRECAWSGWTEALRHPGQHLHVTSSSALLFFILSLQALLFKVISCPKTTAWRCKDLAITGRSTVGTCHGRRRLNKSSLLCHVP